jgi:leucyl-tRNA synthetase
MYVCVQIDSDGRSWRSGATVERRLLKQWMVRTNRYARDMLDGLEQLRNNWHSIVDVQKNWIGPCDYYAFYMPVFVCLVMGIWRG